MIRSLTLASLLAPMLTLSAGAMPAHAQTQVQTAMAGTRLDIVATGEVTRVPDIARINAGVVTQAPTATVAIAQNARQMAAVRAALTKAGIADRDIQTSTISLQPEYRYIENQSPVLTGYRASNEVNVRFRDIADTGRILDALVAQGANQINGPMLSIDKPEEALDEARIKALTSARARADLYARQLGKRVTRILSISESGGFYAPPQPMMAQTMARDAASTKIDPGEQAVSVSLSISFELN
ncbi:MAG: hypothetical protein JWN69_1180 [Alphaproteobacteria bacterium]|nr:hypothetical protein [Alphaproteobacteria bacterium]